MTTNIPMEPLPFSLDEYRGRLARTQAELSRRGLDALLLGTPENIYYLTGYQTTGYYAYQLLIVPASGEPFMVTRKLELTNLGRAWTKRGRAYDDADDPLEVTAECLSDLGLVRARLGFESASNFFTIRAFQGLQSHLSGAVFKPADGIVEELRLIKSAAEIDYLRQAARAYESCLNAAIETIDEGVTEAEVAASAYRGALMGGSEYTASPMYVVSGLRAALGHSTWLQEPIQRGEPVYMELSANVRRYTVAGMRTVCVGEPSALVRRMGEVASAAIETALEATRPDLSAEDVHRAVLAVYERAGWGEHFNKRTGYSIGLGFPPGWGEGHIMDVRPGVTRPLEPGMVFHYPPSPRLPAAGHVGISETLLVTESGCEPLFSAPRRLILK
jgi:Xaa-Pro dipeptidase